MRIVLRENVSDSGTDLVTTNDEGETMDAGVIKEEKIDWVLVGDKAVFPGFFSTTFIP
jgi:hypothetical protein